MLAAQGHACVVCRRDFTHERRFVVDHCHTTNSIRALLCQGYNIAIGQLQDSPKLLRKAAAYIERHRHRGQ